MLSILNTIINQHSNISVKGLGVLKDLSVTELHTNYSKKIYATIKK